MINAQQYPFGMGNDDIYSFSCRGFDLPRLFYDVHLNVVECYIEEQISELYGFDVSTTNHPI